MTPISKKVFPGIGRCIYCGAKEGLSREHIIAFSLGGDHIFQAASCPACSVVTRQEELWCARGIYGPLRLAHRYPTRHKHERPGHIEVEVSSGGKAEKVKVPIDEAPTTPIFAPIFPVAGILIGREPALEIADIQYKLIFPHPPDHDARLRRLRKDGPTEVKVQVRWGLNPFMCMLAKIAHGFAMAAHADRFIPLLPDYILDRDRRLAHVIGCPQPPASLPVPTDAFHGWQVGIRSIGDKHYVAVLLQLFRYLDFPIYEIVAGEATPDLVREVFGHPKKPQL